ncbi:MAG: hypothetical protein ACXWVS_07405 [Hyphomicrobium sp.]
MQIELAAFRKQAPPGGDGERHDEPEQQLRQAFVGSEIAMDQRQAYSMRCSLLLPLTATDAQYFSGTIL